jgi:hypothetical protein
VEEHLIQSLAQTAQKEQALQYQLTNHVLARASYTPVVMKSFICLDK